MESASPAAAVPLPGVSQFREHADPAAAPRPARGDAVSHGRRQAATARIGVVFNRRAHRNAVDAARLPQPGSDVAWAAPRTLDELDRAIAQFAADGVDTLIVDGGDGTVRDVLSVAIRHFPAGVPRMGVVPSGKTNALAIDLGIPTTATLAATIAALDAGRTVTRAPIEILRGGDARPVLRGFLFGAGRFVTATELAQTTHRIGAFRGLAVGMALAGTIVQTAFGGAGNRWRQGEPMAVRLAGGARIDQPLYLLLAVTLERLPLGLKPFGRVRPGLKLLCIDAPPRRLVASVPLLLGGSETPALERCGYRRRDVDAVRIDLPGEFILDGERYPGGALTIRRGAPIDFVVP